ncbi:MAG: GMC family oxidoreductase N-terminal domain-containing protein, partial [Pseudomonadota bacterium]
VGGGTAGCVLAARLSENPAHSVALLEAGPDTRSFAMRAPAAIGALYESGQYHWDYQSLDEPYANQKSLPYKLGRVLGGSSSINGMVYLRGHRADYDNWANVGCEGWDWDSIAHHFDGFETIERDCDNTVKSDRITITDRNSGSSVLNQVFLDAATQAGFAYCDTLSATEPEGCAHLPRNTGGGERNDAYSAFLRPARNRTNLHVICDATAEKIVFDGRRASSVNYRVGSSQETATATRDVILSCGSLASPQLLQLSGIGDPNTLRKYGIDLVHSLPGVGQNLHTHPTIKFTWECLQPVSLYRYTRPPRRWLAGLQWLLSRRGPVASNHFEVGAFLRSNPMLQQPDLELTFLPLALDSLSSSIGGHGFQVYVELVGCQSRGSTTIASANPRDKPQFRFNFLQDERDRLALRAAVDIVRNIVNQEAFDPYRGQEVTPGCAVNADDDKDAWVRDIVSVSHHLVGSCKMGVQDDESAVVTPNLRVRGIENLFVIDASIMPCVVSSNTHAAVLMIAEKGAEAIKSASH